jgi:hypothetical protein
LTQDSSPLEEYFKPGRYRVAQVVRRVNQIFVQRDEMGDGLLVEFVDYETTPHTDISLAVPCTFAELGLKIAGSVGYEVSLWLQQKTSAFEALISLESASTVTLLASRDRGRDVVIVLESNQEARIGDDQVTI